MEKHQNRTDGEKETPKEDVEFILHRHIGMFLGGTHMEFLREDITEEGLVQKMLDTYDVPEEQLRQDVADLVQKLREAEVLDE